MSLKGAIIGLGRMAWEYDVDPRIDSPISHAGAYANIGDVELIAAAEPDAGRRERFSAVYPEVTLFESIDKMMKEKKPQIVSVCTPTSTHAEVIERVAEGLPLAILCEKPFCVDSSQARKISEILSNRTIPVVVNFTRRFCNLHRKLLEIVNEGQIGDIQSAQFFYSLGIRECGSHMIDYASFLFGKLSESKLLDITTPGDDPTAKFFVKCGQNGIPVYFDGLNAQHYNLCEFIIHGTNGRIISRNFGFEAEIYGLRSSGDFENEKEFYLTDLLTDGFSQAMCNALRETCDVAKGRYNPSCGIDDAILSHNVVENLFN